MKTESQLTNTNTINKRTKSSPENTWLKLVEYGEHHHPRGIQVFSRQSADQLVANFNSFRSKLARTFGGLPIYIGHPDDNDFKGQPGHTDTRAYGWVMDMQARPSGLFILPKWSPEGLKIIQNAFYKYLSPRWSMSPVGLQTYEPYKLISVGMTNNPNIQGETIANSALAKKLERQPKFKTTSTAPQLIFGNQSEGPYPRLFFQKVEEHMLKTGDTYLRSWSKMRKENPDIFTLTFCS